jgi:C-terminal processing protease CtpA/Prc
MKYDERGNKVEEAYFDETGKPARHKDGYAAWKARYDDRRNKVELTTFDVDGKPDADTSDGTITTRMKYDDRRNKVEEAYFDEAGKPARHKDGYSRASWSYDSAGSRITSQYFDTDGTVLRAAPIITEVLPDSQAQKLGLRVGDILSEYDGKPARNTAAFIHGRAAEKPGGPTKELKVLRDRDMITFKVAPGLMGARLSDKILPDPRIAHEVKH